MKLRSFRVMNYRCVDDSGDVPVEQVKALVGKNESGKTSVLKALHKFNPIYPEPYNGLKEFPRRRYGEYTDDQPVAQLKFALTAEEKNELSKIDPRLSEASGVAVTRDYAGRHTVTVLPELLVQSSTMRGISPLLSQLREAIEKLDDIPPSPESGIRWKLLDAMSRIGAGIDPDTDLSVVSAARESFDKQIQEIDALLGQNIESERQRQIRGVLQLMLNTVDWPVIEAKLNKFAVERLPVFIYFEDYAILEGRIHLPSFVERLRSGGLSPEEDTARKLLSFVKLDPAKLIELGSREGKSSRELQEAIDTRALMVGRASLSLSGILAELWQQRMARLDLAIDGDYLRLWVADNVDGSRIELEQRSKGFQWFLSFYVVFMTASLEDHRDVVLLLDEPGIHLHASAQEDLLQVLAKLAEKSQIIFTTHSPFMIDLNKLDNLGILVETPAGTKITEPAKTRDKTALFPLQAALAYSLSQAIYSERYNLLVENVTDVWILSAISDHFKELGRGHIDEDIVITPTGGGQKFGLFATILAGQNMDVAVLLDSDAEGFEVRKQLIDSPIGRDTNVIFISDATPEPGQTMQLEDLMPVGLYLKFVNDAYAKSLGKNRITDQELTKGVPVRRYLEEKFQAMGLEFSRFRVARQIMNEFPNIPANQIPSDFVQRMETLFARINKIKPLQVPQSPVIQGRRQSPLRSFFSRG